MLFSFIIFSFIDINDHNLVYRLFKQNKLITNSLCFSFFMAVFEIKKRKKCMNERKKTSEQKNERTNKMFWKKENKEKSEGISTKQSQKVDKTKEQSKHEQVYCLISFLFS